MRGRWEKRLGGGYTFYPVDSISAILLCTKKYVREVLLSYHGRTLDFNFDLRYVSTLSLPLEVYCVCNTDQKAYGASFEDEDIAILIQCLLEDCLDGKELPVAEVAQRFPCELIEKPDEKQTALMKEISELEGKLRELKGKLK